MNNNKHLLVIRLSAMGDVAMTVPVLKSLTKAYPGLKITVLTKAFFQPIFSGLDNVKVYQVEVLGKHKGVFGLWKLFKELEPLQIDAVADLHNVLRSTILKQFFQFAGIPVVQIDKGRKEKKSLTALKNKDFKPLKTTHERYAKVFDRLGYPLKLSLTDTLVRRGMPNNALKLVGNNTLKWLGVAPFAAFSGKMYPLHLMENVIQNLNNTNKYKIFLFGGGQKEKLLLADWQNKYQQCTNMVGVLSFEEELALISNLDTMLSMDSGNAHLAAMYGIPTVTLWGVTHPYSGFYPFGQDLDNALLSDREIYPSIPTSIYGNKAPKGYENVMETIFPDDVFNKVELLLN
ncbi:MAG: glycosyltransferase family 9 protein [Maribacter sp.]|nr:glycosyltransferase family 9 protein [Maribacter sp.]